MIPDLHELFPHDQVDHAAAIIQVFLQELAFQFESRYCGELRRHHANQPRHHDTKQPWLFPPANED